MRWTMTRVGSEAVFTVRIIAIKPGGYRIDVVDQGGTAMPVATATATVTARGPGWLIRAMIARHEELVTGEQAAVRLLLLDIHEIFSGAILTPARDNSTRQTSLTRLPADSARAMRADRSAVAA